MDKRSSDGLLTSELSEIVILVNSFKSKVPMSHHICHTPDCAIAISKASFPVAMNCPVCQQPLSLVEERSALSEEDEQLIANLPYLIAYPLKDTLLQKDPEKRLHRLGYTFINFLKYIGFTLYKNRISLSTLKAEFSSFTFL